MFMIGAHSERTDKRGKSGLSAGAWKPLQNKKLPSSSEMINAPRCRGKYAALLNQHTDADVHEAVSGAEGERETATGQARHASEMFYKNKEGEKMKEGERRMYI